ncbi:MAG: UDP-N-acetylmuramoylalanyl-D-glutamyl-2,6-diaminopimelate--D-alanyl-D-alanine ligase [Alphaproteobacteria bacterium]|nr:UDP-N-acetylmuramoylalanyl-D-glutamyl-2,6-diaminopimelate--D-alanyl-D-alanine ligase [Alphaproteobacteria bacterium]
MEPYALWTSAEAEQATGGRAMAGWTASGVSIDSRTLDFGDLFVALRGPNFDGHDFVRAALEKGASAAMVDRVPEGLAPGAPLLVVPDTLAALEALGVWARRRSGARIVAVTGSVGKTGSKEALRLVLADQGETHAAFGSFNNLWGVPLTLARMPREAHFGVFEIGMNHAGEIAPLARMVRPHVAIITTIEAVHLGNFPSIEAIADAKAEIFAGLEPEGTAIFNRDNPFYDRLAAHAREAGVGRILGFGTHPEAEVRLVNSALHPTCSCVSADVAGQAITYKIGAPGRHWVMNSLAVLAAVRALGGDLGLAGLRLADMSAPKGRGRRHHVAWPGGGFELIDESYNASPVSMRAAFEIMARLPVGPRGRRVAVLGDMLELGERSGELHAGLAKDLVAAGADLVFCAGPQMRRLFESLPEKRRTLHVASAAELVEPLRAALRAGDVVLVKGSLGSRMGPVVDALLAGAPPARAANG